jgi:hypothetical protein
VTADVIAPKESGMAPCVQVNLSLVRCASYIEPHLIPAHAGHLPGLLKASSYLP